MTAQQAYLKFLQQVNRNFSGDNITVDKPTFVDMFNEAQIRRIEFIHERKNDDDIREIQKLLRFEEIERSSTEFDRDNFDLPTDYLEKSSVDAYSSRGSCKNRRMLAWELKDPNRPEHFHDKNNEPSFDYEETPYIVASDRVQVMKNDFTVDKIILGYYRYPRNIDLAGYINEDNVETTEDIDPEMDDRFVNKVIAMCAKEAHRNYQNQLGFQLSSEKIITNQ